MKRLIYIVLAAFAAAAIASACQVAAQNGDSQRDWTHMGNDVAVMLKYQPTDQATYEGKIRQSMHPGQVR